MILIVRLEKGSILPLEKKPARWLHVNARVLTKTQKLSRKAKRKLR